MKGSDFKEITEEHIKTAKKLIKNEGQCLKVDCRKCPFFFTNNIKEESCYNIYTENIIVNKKDKKLVKAAKEFLKMVEKDVDKCKTMGLDEYQKKSARTLNFHNDKNQALSNYSMGLAGESGELIDMLKKMVYHKHEIDELEVKKELGDIMWYVAAIASTFGFSLDEIGKINIAKLLKRYPDKFSEESSINRKE